MTGTPAQLDDPAADPANPDSYVPTGQEPVTDDDPSHYVAEDASIDIEKSTNGEDADVVPGPVVNPGDSVLWEYVVTNPSNTALITSLSVTIKVYALTVPEEQTSLRCCCLARR